jgi:plastocyanin
MKRRLLSPGYAWPFIAGILLVLASPKAADARVHIIKFGGTLGQTYSPSSLQVSVGDTVEWQGNFGFHPLSSTTVPAGATGWHSASGSVFDYVVPVPGPYNYTCDAHGPAMSGSFTATPSGVGEGEASLNPAKYQLQQNYPNPFNPATEIGYAVAGAGNVKLVVYNLIGQEMATLVDEKKSAGSYRVRFEASGLASGVYIYRLIADGFTSSRAMVLLR